MYLPTASTSLPDLYVSRSPYIKAWLDKYQVLRKVLQGGADYLFGDSVLRTS